MGIKFGNLFLPQYAIYKYANMMDSGLHFIYFSGFHIHSCFCVGVEVMSLMHDIGS